MAVFDCAVGEQREHNEEELAAIAAIPGTIELVAAERERRLAGGFDFDFGGARGVHRIGTTEQDRKGWEEVTTAAQTAILLGDPGFEIAIVPGHRHRRRVAWGAGRRRPVPAADLAGELRAGGDGPGAGGFRR
jgi:hypothetical protein